MYIKNVRESSVIVTKQGTRITLACGEEKLTSGEWGGAHSPRGLCLSRQKYPQLSRLVSRLFVCFLTAKFVTLFLALNDLVSALCYLKTVSS